MIQIRNVPDALHRRLKARAALYVAVAEALLTRDRRLAAAARRRVRIELT